MSRGHGVVHPHSRHQHRVDDVGGGGALAYHRTGTDALPVQAKVFGAGTAAVVSPISGFGFKGQDYDLPEIENTFGERLKKRITDIQTNKAEDPFGWRVKV